MAGQLDGKTALVTGGGSGIGRATSLAYAREGARVVVADLNVEGGEETVQLITEAGGQAVLVHADVSDASGAEAMVEQAIRAFGSLDCAFNNAGISGGSASGGGRRITWRRTSTGLSGSTSRACGCR